MSPQEIGYDAEKIEKQNKRILEFVATHKDALQLILKDTTRNKKAGEMYLKWWNEKRAKRDKTLIQEKELNLESVGMDIFGIFISESRGTGNIAFDHNRAENPRL